MRSVLSLRAEFSGFEQTQDLGELTGTDLFDTGLLERRQALAIDVGIAAYTYSRRRGFPSQRH